MMRNTFFCTRAVLMLRVHTCTGNKVETSRIIMCEERIYFILRLETIQPITHLFYYSPNGLLGNGGNMLSFT